MLGGACLFKEGRWVFFVVVLGIEKLEAFLAERGGFLEPAEGCFFFRRLCKLQRGGGVSGEVFIALETFLRGKF